MESIIVGFQFYSHGRFLGLKKNWNGFGEVFEEHPAIMTEINQIINKLNAWCESKGLEVYKEAGYVYEKLEKEEMILDYNNYENDADCVRDKFLNLFFEKIDSEWFLGTNSDEMCDIEEYEREILKL